MTTTAAARAILSVAPVHALRGCSYDIPARAQWNVRIVGFGFSWVGEQPTIEGMKIGSRVILNDNKYRVGDLDAMIGGTRPSTPAGFDVVLSLRFDWHKHSWFKTPREFRCWWIVEDMP